MESYSEFEYFIEADHDMISSFHEMVVNVLKHPLSNYFKEELELFKGSRLVVIVGFNKNTFYNLNLKDILAREVHNDFDAQGLIITYSEIHPDFSKELNNQIDLLPDNICCIIYGGVELTSKENEVEIFVLQ